jgi:hypothetical protein
MCIESTIHVGKESNNFVMLLYICLKCKTIVSIIKKNWVCPRIYKHIAWTSIMMKNADKADQKKK